MDNVTGFNLRSFIKHLLDVPFEKICILGYGKTDEKFILEFNKYISRIEAFITLASKRIIESSFESHNIDENNEDAHFEEIKEFADANIEKYNANYYKFINTGEIFNSLLELEKAFMMIGNEPLYIPQFLNGLNISPSLSEFDKAVKAKVTRYVNSSNCSRTSSGSSFITFEAFGLIFKRYHYLQDRSDFGCHHYMYEVLGNSRYSGMSNKPVIQIYHGPGLWRETILNQTHTKNTSSNCFNYSSIFYNDKKQLCLNFDEIPDKPCTIAFKDGIANFDSKIFSPNEYKDSFILTQTNWAVEPFIKP